MTTIADMNAIVAKRNEASRLGVPYQDLVDADDSARVKGFLDTANDEDRSVIALAFPEEYSEWIEEAEQERR